MLLPYVLFVFLYVEVISSFRSLRAGSQVFALIMLFLCVILHAISSGKSLQLLCILPFGHHHVVTSNYLLPSLCAYLSCIVKL